jgi:hypothetical protein
MNTNKAIKVNLKPKELGFNFFDIYVDGDRTKAYIVVTKYEDGSRSVSLHKTENPGSTPSIANIYGA